MADRQVKAILQVDYQGEAEVLKAQRDLREVDDSAKQAQSGLEGASGGFGRVATAAGAIGVGVVAAGAAFRGLAGAAEAAWGQIDRGADLALQKQQFDALAESIGTTAEALETDLNGAMNGLVSNADQISGAAQLISLGLAKTHEEAVALSEVSGKLNWDMQVLGLTIANQSTARLDSLGLSIESVKGKMAELTASGMSADEAFKWAIIEAGREKIGILGDVSETTAGKIQQLQVSGENLKDSFSELAFTLFEAAGGVEAVGEAADNINLLGDALAKIEKYKEAGLDVQKLMVALAGGDWGEVDRQVTALDTQVQLNEVSWNEWAFAVNNGIYTTGQLSFALGSVDEQMMAQAERVMEAKRSMEAYGPTAYTAALAQEALYDVDLDALNQQIEFQNAAAEAVGRYAEAVAALTGQGGDYFTQFTELDPAAGFDFAQALYDTADAAGAGLSALRDLGAEYGLFDEATAEAATAAAQSQVIMDSIAGAAADGKVAWDDYAAAVQAAMDIINGATTGDRAGVPLPFVGDRPRQLADFELDGTVPEAAPMELQVQLNTAEIDEAVALARGIVEGFTSPTEAYEAVMTMDIADVETKAGVVQALLGEIPDSKEIMIHVSASGMHILEELRAVGAIP